MCFPFCCACLRWCRGNSELGRRRPARAGPISSATIATKAPKPSHAVSGDIPRQARPGCDRRCFIGRGSPSSSRAILRIVQSLSRPLARRSKRAIGSLEQFGDPLAIGRAHDARVRGGRIEWLQHGLGLIPEDLSKPLSLPRARLEPLASSIEIALAVKPGPR